MWTYQKPPREIQTIQRSKSRSIIVPILYFCYFAGCFGGVLSADGSFFAYYSDSLFSLTHSSTGVLFSAAFLSQWIPFTLVLLAGLCAAGNFILPPLFAFKGFAFGCMIAAFYVGAGWHGLLIFWCLFWLPEVGCLFLLAGLARSAWSLSTDLAKNCFLSRTGGSFCKGAKHLLSGYLLSALIGLAGGGLQVALSLVLSGFLFS